MITHSNDPTTVTIIYNVSHLLPTESPDTVIPCHTLLYEPDLIRGYRLVEHGNAISHGKIDEESYQPYMCSTALVFSQAGQSRLPLTLVPRESGLLVGTFRTYNNTRVLSSLITEACMPEPNLSGFKQVELDPDWIMSGLSRIGVI